MSMSNRDIRVCIIGGGPAGLCSLRHILSSSQDIQVALFEQQAGIGGVWNFTGSNFNLWDEKGNAFVFPMYSGLRYCTKYQEHLFEIKLKLRETMIKKSHKIY